MLSSLKLTSFTQIGKEELRKLKHIWQTLQDNHESAEFRNPVDWQGLGLLDYLNIVHNPMDLSTVNNKLNEGKYNSVEAVLDDIQLIWDNCKTYNQHGSWIYDLAQKLEKSFKKMVKNNLPMIALPGVQPKAISTTAKIQQTIKHEEKLKFVERIKELKPDELGILVDKILELCPKAFREVEGENKAQVVVDYIDLETWKKVLATLDSLQQPQDALEKKVKI